MKKKYSIIVPIYNVEEFLEDCIESLISQTYTNIEIILINDGSNDNSELICKKYCKLDNRIKYVYKKNGGVSSARNEGIKHVTGDYIIFVDSDDIVSENLCEVINHNLQNTEADLLQYEYLKIHNKSEISNQGNTDETAFDVYNKDNYFFYYLIKENIKREIWGKVYKKQLFDNIQFPEGRIAEDLATTYKILEKCNKIVCLKNKLYFYRIRKNSIMGKGSFELFLDAMLAHKEIYEYSINKGKIYEIKAYSNYFNNFMKVYAKSYVENNNSYLLELNTLYNKFDLKKLNNKSKLIYMCLKLNKKFLLNLIYNKYIKRRRL